ncbi:DUF4232 domain-containing protein [Corynebacterium sp. AOP40-9SA-29]|uniref:DUF4232 domain-containing protein n=1 Tax=Corynebacterium sp. AOP40-9SA-29 TaxID=3457677 RepID=UPI004034BC43
MSTEYPSDAPSTPLSTAGRPRDLRRRGRTPRRAAGVACALGAASVLTVSVLAGCSDGDGTSSDAGSDASTSTSTPTPVATGEPGSTGTTDTPDDADASGDDGRCTTGDLDVTAGQTQGAAGSILLDVEFTNTSDGSCTLTGFPGVTLVDESGEPVGAPAEREENLPSSVVDLAAGATATSALSIGRAENYDEAACGPTPAGGLQVIVPEEEQTTILDMPDLTACTDDAVSLLTVQPLTDGA